MALCWRRRTFVWRYLAVASLLVYLLFFGAFVSLLSSAPKSLLDLVADDASTNWTATATGVVRASSASSTPAGSRSAGDGRRLKEAAAASAPATKKPTALEDLHKNMTLHKANMSDILHHVQAAVANGSAAVDRVVPDPGDKVANPHPFSYIINSPDICRDLDIYVIAYVHTAPDHYKRRIVIRQTWGDPSNYDVTLRVVFVMGKTLPSTTGGSDVQRALEFEAGQYGDIVQEDFVDTYRNLTFKGVAALRWIDRYCSHARWVLKTDDDIFVNAFNLLRHLHRLDRQAAAAAAPVAAGAAPTAERRRSGGNGRTLLCLVWYNMVVMRDGKWKVGKDEWPEEHYPTYCSGSAFVMSTEVAVALHRVSYDVRFFWVDDFYVTGLLPLKAGKAAVEHVQFISSYVLNGQELEAKFTGPQWYQYVFSHVHNLNSIQSVWKTVARLARGEIEATIPFALPGQLPVVPSSTTTKPKPPPAAGAKPAR